jgi:hypothetical protein
MKSTHLVLMGMLSLALTGVSQASMPAGIDSAGAPAIWLRSVSYITGSSAEFSAFIQPNQSAAVYWIEWGLDTSFGLSTQPSPLRASLYAQRVNRLITGLQLNTTYYIRAVAVNEDGTTRDSVLVFTTLPDHHLPDAIALDADSISKTSARLRGRCDPNGSPAEVYFSWGSAIGDGRTETTPIHDLGDGTDDVEFAETLEGLIPNMTYRFELNVYTFIPSIGLHAFVAQYGYFTTLFDSSVLGLVIPFQMVTRDGYSMEVKFGVHSYATACLDRALGELELPPFAPDLDVRLVGKCLELGSYVDLHAYSSSTQVDTHRVQILLEESHYPIRFSWPDLTVAYAGSVNFQMGDVAVDMKAATSYTVETADFNLVRIIAKHPNPEFPFPSIVMVDGADRPVPGRIDALVQPNGRPTSAWFEWGTSVEYGSSSSPEIVGEENTSVRITRQLSDLVPYKVYHARAVAENATGRIFGPDQLLAPPNITGVIPGEDLPSTFKLFQNYPNPFNPTTVISYSIPPPTGRDLGSHERDGQLQASSRVTLNIYDLLGREVATLVDEEKYAGTYSVSWDASKFASGIYFYKLQGGSHVSVRKMVVAR